MDSQESGNHHLDLHRDEAVLGKLDHGLYNEIMQDIKQIIIPILKAYGVPKAGLFGSFTRGEETTNSDVDILIMPPPRMGLKFVSLKLELEDALKREVDLVSYRAIHPRLKDTILASQVLLYES